MKISHCQNQGFFILPPFDRRFKFLGTFGSQFVHSYSYEAVLETLPYADRVTPLHSEAGTENFTQKQGAEKELMKSNINVLKHDLHTFELYTLGG